MKKKSEIFDKVLMCWLLAFADFLNKKTATISCRCFAFGRQVGFEPTTHGTTIRYSNQLSYNRHVWVSQKDAAKIHFFCICTTTSRFFFLKDGSVAPLHGSANLSFDELGARHRLSLFV